MKIKYLASFVALASAVCLTSCHDDTLRTETSNTGRLNTATILPQVTNAEMIYSDNGATSRASYNLDDYLITVKNEAGETVADWTYATMPSLPTFEVGKYTIDVRSCVEEPAAWEKPYFAGSQSFEIVKNDVTEVETIVCKLANICVTVELSDDLKNAADGDITVNVTSLDENTLSFVNGDSRKGYFQALGQETFEVHFKGKVNGFDEDFKTVIRDVEAGQWRKIKYGVRTNPNPVPDEFGNIDYDGDGISVSTDVYGEDLTSDTPAEEPVLPDSDRPGNDEEPETPPVTPDEPDDPVKEDLFEVSSSTIDLEKENKPVDGLEYKVTIKSVNPLANLKVDIISESLNADMLQGVGLDASFDLAYPGALEGPLKNDFGFPVGNEVIGQREVLFDITAFVPLLNIYKNEIHKFQLTIKDQSGNVKVVTLTFSTFE